MRFFDPVSCRKNKYDMIKKIIMNDIMKLRENNRFNVAYNVVY